MSIKQTITNLKEIPQSSHQRQKSFNFFNRHQQNVLDTSRENSASRDRDNSPNVYNMQRNNNNNSYQSQQQSQSQIPKKSVLGFNQIVIQEPSGQKQIPQNRSNYNSMLKPVQLNFDTYQSHPTSTAKNNKHLSGPNPNNLNINRKLEKNPSLIDPNQRTINSLQLTPQKSPKQLSKYYKYMH